MKKETETRINKCYGLHRLAHLATEVYDILDSFDPYSLQDYESQFDTKDECLNDIATGLIECHDETIEYLTGMIENIESDAPFYRQVSSTIKAINRLQEAITM